MRRAVGVGQRWLWKHPEMTDDCDRAERMCNGVFECRIGPWSVEAEIPHEVREHRRYLERWYMYAFVHEPPGFTMGTDPCRGLPEGRHGTCSQGSKGKRPNSKGMYRTGENSRRRCKAACGSRWETWRYEWGSEGEVTRHCRETPTTFGTAGETFPSGWKDRKLCST